ncbi:hypothetical protein ACVIYL_004368 [Bradyrhizobium sp. USDA 3315]
MLSELRKYRVAVSAFAEAVEVHSVRFVCDRFRTAIDRASGNGDDYRI